MSGPGGARTPSRPLTEMALKGSATMPADAEHTPKRNLTQWQAVGYLAQALVRDMASSSNKIPCCGGSRNKKGAAPQRDPNGMNTMENSKVETGAQAGLSELTSHVETITPRRARHLRNTAHFQRQRKISDINVERLALEMRMGRFTPGTQIFLCTLPNGSSLIVNGNHTLEAIVSSGVPQRLTVTRMAVDDEEQAGRIYAVFDIQKVRTWGDSLRASGMGDDIPNAKYVLAAIGAIENNFSQSRTTAAARSRLNRLEKLEDYRTAAELWTAATLGAPSEAVMSIRRSPVLAVALETFRFQPSLASEFWSRCAHDDGLKNGMPEKALLTWLRNNRGGAGTQMKLASRAAALAWNAAFRGQSRNSLKANSMSSFQILGTPWARGLGR